MTTDTDAIDSKKDNNSPNSSSDYTSKIISFLISIITAILVVLLYFSSGAILLYICKLAQSNIFPTEPMCAPYTNSDAIIKPSPITTNIFTTFTDPEMSMKLQISTEPNSKYSLLDMFREYKQKPSSNFLANYFISISESIMQFNYSSLTMIMNTMNNTFSEFIIVGIGPILCGFLYSIGLLINMIYFVYAWFANMSWFFKTNKNDTGNGLPQWSDVTVFSPVQFGMAIGLVILFSCVFFLGFPIVYMMPLLLYHIVLASTLFYKASMNGKHASAFTIVVETLKYYKLTAITLISTFVVIMAFSKLGTVPGIVSLITLGFIYMGIISIDMFSPIKETNVSPSISYKQATKTCSNVKREKGGMFSWFQKGGNIGMQLKKLNAELKSNT